MVTPQPLPNDAPRWIAGLWVGFVVSALAPLAATYAGIDAAIHRPSNVALASALMGVLLVAGLAAFALPVWRLSARLAERLPGPVWPHAAATIVLAAWLSPPTAVALAIATAAWWIGARKART